MLYNIPFDALQLTLQEVYDSMGYRGATPESEIAQRTHELLLEASKYATPTCYFILTEGILDSNNITIGSCTFEVGRTIAGLMKGATQYAIFVATAGDGFQSWYDQVAAGGDCLDAFLVDSIGSCIAESAGDYMERQLDTEINGLLHTNRFSPGYCGWKLTEQRELFSVLPPNVCGISLNDSCLMHPIKSISGIVGVGANVKTKVYSCHVCEKTDCFRRITNRK